MQIFCSEREKWMRKMVLKNAVADDDGAASLVQKTPMHKSNKKN